MFSKAKAHEHMLGDAFMFRVFQRATLSKVRADIREAADSSWQRPYRFLKSGRNENSSPHRTINSSIQSNTCLQAASGPEANGKLISGKSAPRLAVSARRPHRSAASMR